MLETVIRTKDLTKQYRKAHTLIKFYALNKFNMEIHRGDIYGFVGNNGAGKTTLMRILTGMTGQTGGEIEIFGKYSKEDLILQRGRIGAIIETPALYQGMTAKENLEAFRLQRGIENRDSILDILDTVGLTGTDAKKVKNFSLGMKQRLGLAIALLGNQELLVLDEPVNGLDPEGIVEFREIIKKLNQEKGVTVLISSHLLTELDQLATCYGFIHDGKMVEQISAEELREKCNTYLVARVNDVQKAKKILQKVIPQYKVEIVAEHKIHIYGFMGDTGDVMKELLDGGVNIKDIRTNSLGLEDYYMSVIRGGNV